MNGDARRFDGEVYDGEGAHLGEARFWGTVDRDAGVAGWRGWLRLADLERGEMPAGRYRVRSFEGWEAEFEPLGPRPSRVVETDLLPIRGIGERPWPEADDAPVRYRPAFGDTPPREARDRSYNSPNLADLDPIEPT
jgi:hypothetical protein